MQYWANINGTQYGPVQKEQLIGLGLTPESYVWRQGLDEWVQVKSFDELADLFPEAQVSPSDDINDAPIAEEEPVQSSEEQKEEPQPPHLPQQTPYQYQQQYAPQQPIMQPVQPSEPCPPTNIAWAILTTILCCQIFGIIAIIYAAQVSSSYHQGNLEKAKKYSDRAAMWSIISIVTGMLYVPFAIAFQFLSSI